MTDDFAGPPPDAPLPTLFELGRRARAAAGPDELSFLLVNETRALLPYRQGALYFSTTGVRAVSGLIQADRSSPFMQWLDRCCRHLAHNTTAGEARALTADQLPPALAADWNDWLPPHAVWVPFSGTEGGLLLAGDTPLTADDRAWLREWVAQWHLAWRATMATGKRTGLGTWLPWAPPANPELPWWKRRAARAALLIAALACLPVRLTVLAPGELVAANPAVIRAPIDGVIDRFHVEPNQPVRTGDLLFTLDEAAVATRREVARQSLSAAESEYRQAAQMALADARAKGQMVVLLGKAAEKRAELDFLQGQFQRAKVVAPADGIALVDDPGEWIGRPVQTGERVMRIANPAEVEIELWIPIGDAIPLADDAPVTLYLAADPLDPIAARLRYLGHDALPRPDGSYAYRARATLTHASGQRIGLRGTARLEGARVPLGYWLLRHPLATTRQFLAI